MPTINADGVVLGDSLLGPIVGELPPAFGQFDGVVPCGDARHTFGEWLLSQMDRKGWVADLGKSAKSDIRFPRTGGLDDVRKRRAEVNVEGDTFEALDDAELHWLVLWYRGSTPQLPPRSND